MWRLHPCPHTAGLTRPGHWKSTPTPNQRGPWRVVGGILVGFWWENQFNGCGSWRCDAQLAASWMPAGMDIDIQVRMRLVQVGKWDFSGIPGIPVGFQWDSGRWCCRSTDVAPTGAQTGTKKVVGSRAMPPLIIRGDFQTILFQNPTKIPRDFGPVSQTGKRDSHGQWAAVLKKPRASGKKKSSENGFFTLT